MASMDIVFDMETNDPDDALTLALLATHPRSNLVGVTVHPGGTDQVGVVKTILKRLGKPDVPVGAAGLTGGGSRVSGFHYRWLGDIPGEAPDGTAKQVIQGALETHQDVYLVTGAALTNIALALDQSPLKFAAWTCQGGFAGDSIMPPELRLPKFAGKETCPTFNLGGDSKAADMLLCQKDWTPAAVRYMVPKSVCHGIFWTQEFQSRVPVGAHPGLDLILQGMQMYFRRRPEGKALHDVLAAAVALSPEIGISVPVWPYRVKGEWGSQRWELGDETVAPPLILTRLDLDGFLEVLAR